MSHARTTRSNVDSTPIPKEVHGTFCCIHCGTMTRDGTSAISIGMSPYEREATGNYIPSFRARTVPISAQMDPIFVSDLLEETSYNIEF